MVSGLKYPLFLLVLFGLSFFNCNKSSQVAEIGRVAPDFVLDNVKGGQMRLIQNRGKVVLLRFWSDWCINCKLEMSELELSYRKLTDQGFEVLAVYVKPENESSVIHLAQELKLTFPVLIDKDGKLASEYGVARLPTNFIIDKKGIIREKVIGEGLNRKELLKLTAPYS